MKKAYGFTIIELMVVIIVIGILAGIGMVSYNGLRDRAIDIKRREIVQQVVDLTAILYKRKNVIAPLTSRGALDSEGVCQAWPGAWSLSGIMDPLFEYSNPSSCGLGDMLIATGIASHRFWRDMPDQLPPDEHGARILIVNHYVTHPYPVGERLEHSYLTYYMKSPNEQEKATFKSVQENMSGSHVPGIIERRKHNAASELPIK